MLFLGEKIGFEWCWVIFGFINLLYFLPMLGLMKYGEKARRTIPPNFDKDRTCRWLSGFKTILNL